MTGNTVLWCRTTSRIVVMALVILSLFSLPIKTTGFSIHGENLNQQVLLVTTPPTTGPFAPNTINSQPIPPEICSFHVQSDIKHRYSRTLITSRVANKDIHRAQEVRFSVVLPETAFIFKFVMEIDGTSYEAYVKEKEQAKNDYVAAQSHGQSAGLVEKSTRNSNVFNVNVNVMPQSNITFNLSYEELLKRKTGHYEQIININPDHVRSISDYKIVVNVEESTNLTFVRVPSLSNDINAQDHDGNTPDVVILKPAPNKATVTWTPSRTNQEKLASDLSSGQFLVQYDLDREADAGQILLMQGYFVHFFSPERLSPLRKHIVFILDTSGSMAGRRLEQLKESQNAILDDLSADDFFNIITFSGDVRLWAPEGSGKEPPFPATPDNVMNAKSFINSLGAYGGTNIHGAINDAIKLTGKIMDAQRLAQSGRGGVAEASLTTTTTTTNSAPENDRVKGSVGVSKEHVLPSNVHSLIVFLTDGEPTAGITNPTEIQDEIRSANQNLSIPIYSLGFGPGADFPFLKKLSLQNSGFARKIYEASDAALQMEGFYSEISSPLLSNVTFQYTSDEHNFTDLTVTRFPTAFRGAEIAVAGKMSSPPEPESFDNKQNDTVPRTRFAVTVGGVGREGDVSLTDVTFWKELSQNDTSAGFQTTASQQASPASRDDEFLERLWAYLTISQLIEQDSSEIDFAHSLDVRPLIAKTTRNETSRQRALRLALKYSFVTPLTSLVVVKPNSSDVADAAPNDGPSETLASAPSQKLLTSPLPTLPALPSTTSPSVNYPSPNANDVGGLGQNSFEMVDYGFESEEDLASSRSSFSSQEYHGPITSGSPPHHNQEKPEQGLVSGRVFYPSLFSRRFSLVSSHNRFSSQEYQRGALSSTASPAVNYHPKREPVQNLHLVLGRPSYKTFGSEESEVSSESLLSSQEHQRGGSNRNGVRLWEVEDGSKEGNWPNYYSSQEYQKGALTSTASPSVNYHPKRKPVQNVHLGLGRPSYKTFGSEESEASSERLLSSQEHQRGAWDQDDITWQDDYSLASITWLDNNTDLKLINGFNYTISRRDTSGDNENYECHNFREGHQGHCKHLRNCVLPRIAGDFNTYRESYFCEITSNTEHLLGPFAGVCCPSIDMDSYFLWM